MKFNLHNVSPALLEKINHLYNLLIQRKTVYEKASASIPDKEFQNTLLRLASESNEYAGEISVQVQTFGLVWVNQKNNELDWSGHIKNESDLLRFCKATEVKLVNAYYAILKEANLYGEVKKIVRSQLNNILNTFLKLKLLSVLKPR